MMEMIMQFDEVKFITINCDHIPKRRHGDWSKRRRRAKKQYARRGWVSRAWKARWKRFSDSAVWLPWGPTVQP
jgi:hypothetical protein